MVGEYTFLQGLRGRYFLVTTRETFIYSFSDFFHMSTTNVLLDHEESMTVPVQMKISGLQRGKYNSEDLITKGNAMATLFFDQYEVQLKTLYPQDKSSPSIECLVQETGDLSGKAKMELSINPSRGYEISEVERGVGKTRNQHPITFNHYHSVRNSKILDFQTYSKNFILEYRVNTLHTDDWEMFSGSA